MIAALSSSSKTCLKFLMASLSSLYLSFFDGVSLTAKGNKVFFMTHYSIQVQWRKSAFSKLTPNLMSKQSRNHFEEQVSAVNVLRQLWSGSETTATLCQSRFFLLNTWGYILWKKNMTYCSQSFDTCPSRHERTSYHLQPPTHHPHKLPAP